MCRNHRRDREGNRRAVAQLGRLDAQQAEARPEELCPRDDVSVGRQDGERESQAPLHNTGQIMKTLEQPSEMSCLFLDVDGTLIDLAPTPDSVVVPAGLIRALTRAEQTFGGALALVSGRSIAQLDRLFDPVRFKASGVHGAEFRLTDSAGGRWSKANPLPVRVWDELSTLLSEFRGTLVENKAFSYAVHYRATPGSGPRLHAALETFLAERSDLGLQILPGHFVYELKQPGIDKGEAIRTLMAHGPFSGRVPIFIGDDVTDVPGFTAVKAFGGFGYSVGRAFPDVAGTFGAPAAVRDWLAKIGKMEAQTA